MKRLLLYLVYALGIIAVTVMWWRASGSTTMPNFVGYTTAIGHITGLLGTYLILWQLVLLSRLPIFDQSIGLEHVTWLHRWNGYGALILLLGHTLFLTLGYAAVEHATVLTQFITFQVAWEDVLKATIGLAMLIGIVGISIYIVRRRLKYELWYWVHLSSYLAIVLAFSHQLSQGPDFAHQPVYQAFWLLLYVAAFGSMAVYRFLAPIYLFARHRFTVDRVVQESDSVVSVYVTGRDIERIHYQPGQFFIWRFLDADRWWQAHPFTVSEAPGGKHIRLTAKELGDFTRDLPKLKPETPVSIDGPHGHLTSGRVKGSKLVMVAGGIGITPIRAMIEALPESITDTVIIFAARSQADLVLRDELDIHTAAHRARLIYILSDETAAGYEHGFVTQAALKRLVPDIAEREMVLCGPPRMMASVSAAAQSLGLPKGRIYQERFAYVS